jgi:imidazolonepropionase-like amidohydrolase
MTAAGVLGWRGGSAAAQVPPDAGDLMTLLRSPETGEVITSFALHNVTLIDGTGKPAQPGITVVISGNRIESLQRDTPPKAGIRTEDGTGKFLIPGLWDMHAHLDGPNLASLPIFITQGVTGIRTMGGRVVPLQRQFDLRNSVAAGRRLGPRLVVPVRLIGIEGMGIPPPPPEDRFPATERVITADEVRNAVHAAVDQYRADFIKVHNGLSREIFFAILSEGRALKIPVAGHVTQLQAPVETAARTVQETIASRGASLVTLAEASNAGLASIEHMDTLRRHLRERGAPNDVVIDDLAASHKAWLADLFALFRQNRTWFCPTLTDTERAGRILPDDPRLKYFSASQRAAWMKGSGAIPLDQTESAARVHRAHLSFTKAMHQAGVGLLAGTDFSPTWGMAGFGLHEELKQFVAAGLSPMDALRTATYNPAQFLGLLDTIGTIEPGKESEMVLLDGNPLDDIRNTAKINRVFTNGRTYSRQALDRMLAAVEVLVRI